MKKTSKRSWYRSESCQTPCNGDSKTKIIGNQVGFYKVLVDASNNQIVGATLFEEEAHEVINIIATAMNANLPTQFFAIKSLHPTMAEALNDVFGMIQ